MIEVKINSDIPLPTPRSVINSPSHITTAVPAVKVMTMAMIKPGDCFGMSCSLHPGISRPGVRASAKMAVDCKIASPMVR